MLLKKIEGLQGELGVQIDSWTSTWKAMSSTSPLVVRKLLNAFLTKIVNDTCIPNLS